jgi:hypothetical protein
MDVWWAILSVLAPIVFVALIGTTILYALSRRAVTDSKLNGRLPLARSASYASQDIARLPELLRKP